MRIKLGLLRPFFGSYGRVNAALDSRAFGTVVDVKEELQDKECEACALGGLFVAAVDRFNDLQLPLASLFSMRKSQQMGYLVRFFTVRELEIIEAAFEGTDQFVSEEDHDWDTVEHAVRWAGVMMLDYAQPRMEAIAKNIIRNKGTFDPRDFEHG